MARANRVDGLIEERTALARDLRQRDPELAERFERLIDRIDPKRSRGDYVSPGEAATELGVSANTIKKWVRAGLIRDVWALPGSGYLKIARSEVERIRREAVPARREEH